MHNWWTTVLIIRVWSVLFSKIWWDLNPELPKWGGCITTLLTRLVKLVWYKYIYIFSVKHCLGLLHSGGWTIINSSEVTWVWARICQQTLNFMKGMIPHTLPCSACLEGLEVIRFVVFLQVAILHVQINF
jgi:hypothetical protein